MLDSFLYTAEQGVAPILEFIERGGPVLAAIALLSVIKWWYVFERVWYFRNDYPLEAREFITQWQVRRETNSWNSQQIRQAMISRINDNLNQSTIVIRAIIRLCPLLGLLGTVTGMIDVFDVMAVSSGVDTKSMSASVSRAIIPTMGGMLAAITGIFANMYIQRRINQLSTTFEEALTIKELCP